MNESTSYPRMHVSLYVKDLDATLDFYRQFFGQEPEKVKPHYAKFHLAKPALVISFVENAERVNSDFGHLGFQVETKEEMLEHLENMRQAGLVSKEEIGTACCYAVQDKFWATDPDGHQWEVYYFHSDSEFNDPQYEMEDAEACCTPATEPKKKVALADVGQEESCCEPGSGCC